MKTPAILDKEITLFSTYTSQWTLCFSMWMMFSLAYTGFTEILGRDYNSGIVPQQSIHYGQIYALTTILVLVVEYIAAKTNRHSKFWSRLDVGCKIIWLLFTLGFNFNMTSYIDSFHHQDSCGGNSAIACDPGSFYTGFIQGSLIAFTVIILRGWNKQQRLFSF